MSLIDAIHWANYEKIILLPLFLFAIVLIFKNFKNTKKYVALLVHHTNQASILKHFSLRRLFCKAILLSIGLLAIFLALLQPQWGHKEEIVEQEGRDILIMLDVSRSMSAKDVSPSRLQFAKTKIRNFIHKLSCERVGLIVFSNEAFTICPLTSDMAAFNSFLDHVDTEVFSSGATSIDRALLKALEVFKTSPDRKNKLALLLTDGEDFSMNLSAAENQAIKEDLHVFALGIGSVEGAPIPIFDHTGRQIGHEVSDSGSIILSKLNESLLQTLCKQVKGFYSKSGYDDTDINTMLQHITNYEKERFGDAKISLYQDQYPWFLAISWLCFALEWII